VLAGSGRLVDPLSVEGIAAGMLEVLVNRPLRETMIAKGLERARDFGWERCARAVLDVFDSLDGSRAADLQGMPPSTTAGSAP
jgi:glycosyltransferase involved in cell wall biosynthesis